MARLRLGLLLLSLALLVSTGSGQASSPAPIRIMPLGDSITSSVPGQASYRYWLYGQLLGGGYTVDFVGSLWGVYEPPLNTPRFTDFDADHEGHYGKTADYVRDYISAWAAAAAPDVVLIHLGHNDLWFSHSIESTLSELGEIIDRLRAANPNVKILLAKLIPSSIGGELNRIPELNAQIPALAASKHTPASPVRVVDQFTGFDPLLDTLDGVHPNEAGEKKISARWYTTLHVLLSGKPVVYLPWVNR